MRPGRGGSQVAPPGLIGRDHQSITAGNSDRRSPAHPQALDRLHHRGHVAAGDPLEDPRQERLVDEFDVAIDAPHPLYGDGNAHAVIPKASATARQTSRPSSTLTAERTAGLDSIAAAIPWFANWST